jgi:hypothetical protein
MHRTMNLKHFIWLAFSTVRCEADIWAFTAHINQCSGEIQRRLIVSLHNYILVNTFASGKVENMTTDIENQRVLESKHLTAPSLFPSATTTRFSKAKCDTSVDVHVPTHYKRDSLRQFSCSTARERDLSLYVSVEISVRTDRR